MPGAAIRHNTLRMQGYDYALQGCYSVTIVAQHHLCLFGRVADGQMSLNSAGQMLSKWWQEICNKFTAVRTDEFVVMPNHFHGILLITDPVGVVRLPAPDTGLVRDPVITSPVGADLCACDLNKVVRLPDPDTGLVRDPVITSPVGADPCVRPTTPPQAPCPSNDARPNLSKVIQWFKTMTTNAYIRGVRSDAWQPFHGQLWQRSYYDHIIRSAEDLDNTRQYIMNNPLKWELDRENPKNNEP